MAVVLDLHTRRVVGWSMSDRPDADLVVKVLEMAYQQRGSLSGVLFHSNQGSQCGSRVFLQRLWRYRMTRSMNLREEMWDISDYLMNDYNWRRPHQHNDGIPPAEAEKGLNCVSRLS